MKISNQLKAGSLLTYLNLLLNTMIPLFYTPIMLDILGQEEYGVFALSNSITGYLSMLSFGMGSAIIRYITRAKAQGKEDDVRRMMGLFITIYSVLSMLVLVVGAVLILCADIFFGKGLTPDEIGKLRILLVFMAFNTAVSFPISVFSSVVVSYERYVANKLVHIAETLATPVLNLIALFMGFGSVGLASVAIPIQLANLIYFGFYCYKKLNVYPVFKNMPTHILKELIGFCFFIFLSSIVDMLYWATDKVLIGALIGSAAVAVYNIGGTFTFILQRMALAISGVFSPRVNILSAQGAPREAFSELLTRIGRIQYLLISLVLSGYAVFGQYFIRIWAGEEYMEAYYIGLLTMVPLGIPLIQNIAFATILAENKHRFRSIVYAIIAVLNVVSTYLVLPYYGIVGAAVCTAVSFLLGQGIIMNVYYHKVIKLDIPHFWLNIAKLSLIPGAMIAGTMYLVNHVLPVTNLWWFLLWVAVYTVIFTALTWLFSMNRYEKDLILSLIHKVFPKRKIEPAQ